MDKKIEKIINQLEEAIKHLKEIETNKEDRHKTDSESNAKRCVLTAIGYWMDLRELRRPRERNK